MENTKVPTSQEVKQKVLARLELDKGKSLDEIYHDECDRLYNSYLKMEETQSWSK